MSKLEANQVDPATGTTLTLGTSGDTIAIPSGVTIANSGTSTGFGGENTPAFSAYMSADQSSIADNTSVKVNMNTEFFDSDGKYDTSNYRFTPTIAGEYVFGSSLHINSGNNMETVEIALYKNGSKLLYATTDSNDGRAQITGIINLDTDDYVELYAYVNVASGGAWNINQDGTTSNNRCYWYGYKVIGA